MRSLILSKPRIARKSTLNGEKSGFPLPPLTPTVYHHYLAVNRKLIKSRYRRRIIHPVKRRYVPGGHRCEQWFRHQSSERLPRERAPCSVRNNRVSWTCLAFSYTDVPYKSVVSSLVADRRRYIFEHAYRRSYICETHGYAPGSSSKR